MVDFKANLLMVIGWAHPSNDADDKKIITLLSLHCILKDFWQYYALIIKFNFYSDDLISIWVKIDDDDDAVGLFDDVAISLGMVFGVFQL